MLSQYANSPTIVKLVNGINEQLNNAQTIEDWFRIVFDLRTATGFGLDIWGKILNQSRRFQYVDENNQTVDVYLQGNQTVDGVDYTAEQMDNFYRTALFLKAFSYIADTSLKNINDMLNFYFNMTSEEGREGKAFAYNIGTMAIEIVFTFFMPKLEKAILTSDLFPTPAGVQLNYRFIPNGAWLGFYDENAENPEDQPFAPFNHKPFYPY